LILFDSINARVKRAYQAVEIIPEREFKPDERYRGGQLFEKEPS
jgi:hypothetical protein